MTAAADADSLPAAVDSRSLAKLIARVVWENLACAVEQIIVRQHGKLLQEISGLIQEEMSKQPPLYERFERTAGTACSRTERKTTLEALGKIKMLEVEAKEPGAAAR